MGNKKKKKKSTRRVTEDGSGLTEFIKILIKNTSLLDLNLSRKFVIWNKKKDEEELRKIHKWRKCHGGVTADLNSQQLSRRHRITSFCGFSRPFILLFISRKTMNFLEELRSKDFVTILMLEIWENYQPWKFCIDQWENATCIVHFYTYIHTYNYLADITILRRSKNYAWGRQSSINIFK